MVRIISSVSFLEPSGNPRNLFRSTCYLLPLFVFVCFVVQSGGSSEVDGYSDLGGGDVSEDATSFDAEGLYDLLGRQDKRARYGGFRGDLGKRQGGISLRDIGMDSDFFKNLRLKDVLARKGRVSRKFRGDLGKRSFASVPVKEEDKNNY